MKEEKKMERTPTWNNVGKDIKGAKTIEEALNAAELNYKVVKAPVYLSNGHKIKDTYCTKVEGTNKTFGIVGKDYSIVQNNEALSFIDHIGDIKFVKAGENNWMLYVIASLPSVNVLGDQVTPYIIFQNSHCGCSTLKAAISPLRMICQNQFNMAFKNSENKIMLRHTPSVNGKLHTAQEVLQLQASYMDDFSSNATMMATTKLNRNSFDNIINSYFKIDEESTTRKINHVEENKARFLNAYNADDNQNFKGTVWGMTNAFADYVTHSEPIRKTEKSAESKFINVSLNAKVFDEFMNIVRREA
jgi:phage/plasmid-like protein (TIGR03299 family)